ncbi:putative hydrolase [Ameyamaea chiangmaiensis NBRC 103196]|nr:putative hydrolase [Ameyamaea chiangmaiensis NBRC 103196]
MFAAIGVAVIVGGWVAGPRVEAVRPVVHLPTVPQDAQALTAFIDEEEAHAGPLRDDTRARIVWATPDSPHRTECSMVYLHGFSASQGEGGGLPAALARQFGCNLYLARLPGHGLAAPDAMAGLNAQTLADGAARALAIGNALGERTILIGTSTGGSLALLLASQVPERIGALVLWSPLVRERGNKLDLLFQPWGLWALRLLQNRGGAIVHKPSSSPVWASDLHVDGYRALAELTRGAMNARTFGAVTAPTFVGYYYRDEAHQDQTVSVAAIKGMAGALGTPADRKRVVDFPDAGTHVIPFPGLSQASAGVEAASADFLRTVVGLTPAAP